MIGKVINNLLEANVALVALVPVVNIYPYVMNSGTALPAIIYTIDSLETEYNKDGLVQDNYTFSVATFSNDYAILQSIVTQVRIALEGKRGSIEGLTIQPIYLRGMKEAYSIGEDTFGNILTFDVNVI